MQHPGQRRWEEIYKFQSISFQAIYSRTSVMICCTIAFDILQISSYSQEHLKYNNAISLQSPLIRISRKSVVWYLLRIWIIITAICKLVKQGSSSHCKMDLNIQIKVFWEARCSRYLEDAGNKSDMFLPICLITWYHIPDGHNVTR